MTVVFINEPSSSTRQSPPEPAELASRGVVPPDLPLMVLSPDPLPAAEAAEMAEASASSSEPAADQTQHALLYGRYLGQVQARIERAWSRPRGDIGAPTFSCRVRIEQDRLGNVVDIAVDHCNGTERWRQSLLTAVRTASPLPAPPDPSVYADRIWLAFRSERFRAETSTEGFEPEDRGARDSDSEVHRSFENFASRLDGSSRSLGNEHSDVIHLTIVGSPRSTPTSAESNATTLEVDKDSD